MGWWTMDALKVEVLRWLGIGHTAPDPPTSPPTFPHTLYTRSPNQESHDVEAPAEGGPSTEDPERPTDEPVEVVVRSFADDEFEFWLQTWI